MLWGLISLGQDCVPEEVVYSLFFIIEAFSPYSDMARQKVWLAQVKENVQEINGIFHVVSHVILRIRENRKKWR